MDKNFKANIRSNIIKIHKKCGFASIGRAYEARCVRRAVEGKFIILLKRIMTIF